MSQRTSWRETGLRAALSLLLGGWLGAWFLFAFGVTTTAFRILPSTEMAGKLVGPILSGLNLYGIAAGVALAGIAAALSRRRLLWLIPLVLAGLCLYSEFVITPGIQAVREGAFGPNGSLEASERFSSLHRQSLRVFTGVGLGAIVLLILHAREDTHGKNPSTG